MRLRNCWLRLGCTSVAIAGQRSTSMSTGSTSNDGFPTEAGLSCLVVEDQPEVRTLIALIVRRVGFTVYEADSGAAARARLSEIEPGNLSLAIIDLSLPDQSGDTLCPVFRSHSPRAALILTSGHGAEALEEVARNYDGVHSLPKPFVPSLLKERIRELVSPRQSGAAGEG